MNRQKRREFLKLAGVGIAAMVPLSCRATEAVDIEQPASNAKRPNIVFILADDLGYGDLGCYGSKDIKTPNLDALARDGMKFTGFYVNAPVCSPTRAGFMTGRSQQRCGAESVFTPGNMQNGLPVNETTVAEELKRGGYATGIFGKWHLGYIEQFNPVQRGFDRFIGSLSGFLDYHTHINPRLGYDWMDGLQKKEEKGYSTDLISKHSIEFIREHKEQPFFLFVSHQAPHSPYQGPDDGPLFTLEDGAVVKQPKDTRPNDVQAAERYAKYVEMTEHMDKTVGDLLKALREEGLAENTLVMFVSDNGPSWLAGTTGGLSSGKHFLQEGGIRVPAMAYWPGRIKPGTVTDETATILDLFPTFLGLAGIEPHRDLELDGTDLGRLLLEQKPLPERALCWRYEPQGQVAVRRGKWKLMGRYNRKDGVVDFSEKAVTLFNLKEDIAEENNLAATHPEIVTRLKEDYMQWDKGIQADRKRLERMQATADRQHEDE